MIIATMGMLPSLRRRLRSPRGIRAGIALALHDRVFAINERFATESAKAKELVGPSVWTLSQLAMTVDDLLAEKMAIYRLVQHAQNVQSRADYLDKEVSVI